MSVVGKLGSRVVFDEQEQVLHMVGELWGFLRRARAQAPPPTCERDN